MASFAAELPYSGNSLRLWLKADGSLTLDGAPNTNRVIGWNDTIGFGGNTVAQNGVGPSGNRPLWVDNVINGQPVVRFDGGSRRIDGAAVLPAGSGARTIIIVASSVGPGNQILFDSNGQGSGSVAGDRLFRITPEVRTRYGNGNTAPGPTNATSSFSVPTTPIIFGVRVPTGGSATQGNVTYFNNNSTAIAGTASSPGALLDTGNSGYRFGGSTNWQGDVAEVLVFEQELTNAELNRIGFYLGQKYALGSFTAPTDVYFDDLGAGSDWSTGANWDAATQPVASQNAFINGGKTAIVTAAGEVAGSLTIGSNSTGGPNTPGTGALTLTSGSLTITNDLTLGAGSAGTLNYGAGTISIGGNVVLGNSGGTFNVGTGDAETLSNTISGPGGLTKTGDGMLTLNGINSYLGDTTVNGGTLRAAFNGNPVLGAGSLHVNSGATLRVEGFATISSGQVINLNNGNLELRVNNDGTWGNNINVLNSSTMLVRNAADPNDNKNQIFGNLNFTGPTNTALTINSANGHTAQFGNISGTAGNSYIRDGNAAITVTGTISGMANIFFDGGTTTGKDSINVTSFRVGNAAGSNGAFIFDAAGKTLTNTTALFVGASGNGELTINQASSNVVITNRLQVADTGSSNGTLNFIAGTINAGGMFIAGNGNDDPLTIGAVVMGTTGGNLTDARLFTQGANLEVANSGKGSFTQHSGTVTVQTNNLILGQAATGDGVYTLNGGKVDILAGLLRIGNTGKGVFNQNGGEVVVSSNLDMGNVNTASSSGAYNMTAGTLTVGNALLVGSTSQGAFVQSGGNVTVNGFMDVGAASTGAGSYTISNPGATLEVLGQFEVGDNGTGTFLQNNGTVKVNTSSGNAILGQTASGVGSYTINNGSFETPNLLRVGNTGMGTFTQNGGTVTVGSILDLGNSDNPNSNGTYHYVNGVLNLGNALLVGNAANAEGEFNLGSISTAPSFTANQVVVGLSGNGMFNHINGTMNINGANDLVIGQNAGSNGEYHMQGGNLVTLAGASGNLIFFNGSGLFDQTGGTVLISRDILMSNNAANNSTYQISSGELEVVGNITDRAGTSQFFVDGGLAIVGGNATLDHLRVSGTGTLDFQDHAGPNQNANGPANQLIINSGGTFQFDGGVLMDVTVIDPTYASNTLVQDGGAFVVGRNGAQNGANAATTTILGAYTQNDGILALDIVGQAQHEIDMLIVEGNVEMAGELAVQTNFVELIPFMWYDAVLTTDDYSISLLGGFGVSGLPYFRVINDPSGNFSQILQVAVPEPSSIALWGLLTAALGCYLRRRRSRRGG